jgi:hypothetical protein
MSFSAIHQANDARSACAICRDRKARFRYRGQVCADRDHVLCFQCYRSQREPHRARVVAQFPTVRVLPPSLGDGAPALTERQRAHRWQMLTHLRGIAERDRRRTGEHTHV